MLRSVKKLVGYSLAATNQSIGEIKDFLFDDAQWTVRWMVADTGDWLPGRKVLISPISLGNPDWSSHLFPVRLTKEDIERAPALDTDEPVAKAYERAFFDQYGWEYYWGLPGVWGGATSPEALFRRQETVVKSSTSPDHGSHVLRSAEELFDYQIRALDGEIGHIEDFIVDTKSWTIRYMVVDTGSWLSGRKVLIATDWISDIEWADRQVFVNLSSEAVKGSPEYLPSAPVNREDESNLYDYYGRPVYWLK